MTKETISMIEDGRRLAGDRWITPADFATAEVMDGSLPSMKGITPPTLPSLNNQDQDNHNQE